MLGDKEESMPMRTGALACDCLVCALLPFIIVRSTHHLAFRFFKPIAHAVFKCGQIGSSTLHSVT